MALSEKLITSNEHETLTEFQNKIDQATLNGDEWVETTPAIIKYFNRNGLGRSEYFIYKGIKVCVNGQSERIQNNMNKQLGQVIYGDQEAKVNQGFTTKPQITNE